MQAMQIVSSIFNDYQLKKLLVLVLLRVFFFGASLVVGMGFLCMFVRYCCMFCEASFVRQYRCSSKYKGLFSTHNKADGPDSKEGSSETHRSVACNNTQCSSYILKSLQYN